MIKKTMRDTFLERLYEIMLKNEDVYFISADFGAPLLDKMRENIRDRFINVGIAEQNLINVATGLALEGATVYTYLIAPFVMRAYEQIRINLSMSSQNRQINVNIIGVGAGLSYEVSGPTHHCMEDISIMRLLPNISVFSPSDWRQVESFVQYSIDKKSPKYLRFDGKPSAPIYEEDFKFSFEDGFSELTKGDGVCLVSTGFMTHRAIEAAEILSKKGVRAGVVDVFMLKPFDREKLFNVIGGYRHVVTIEEAFIGNGGLDSLVFNLLSWGGSNARVHPVGLKDHYAFEIGLRDYLHKLLDMDADAIVKLVSSLQS